MSKNTLKATVNTFQPLHTKVTASLLRHVIFVSGEPGCVCLLSYFLFSFLVPYVIHCFRYCRAGAGTEVTPNKCDTPGFVIRDKPAIVADDRNYMKLEMPRNHTRMVQTPLKVLRGWRGNCDVKVLLYRSDGGDPGPSEIAKVTDYIVSYACKGNEKLQVEKDIMKDMIER